LAELRLAPYDPPRPAPAFALPDLDGVTRRLEDYRGRPVILYFWTSACPTCRGELPHVNRLWAEYRAAGLEVLLVDFREPLDVVRRTASERRYAAPVLLDDTGDVTGRLYGVWGTPTVYVIDRAGRLIARGVGPRDWTTPAARRL